MTNVSKLEFTELVNKLNTLVRRASGPDESALAGLTAVTKAFGAMLDVYADPNDNNPEGMCDSKDAFRKHFACIIEGGIL